MTLASLAALFLTMLVLSAVPGPSDFLVVARTLSAGFRHAVLMVLGILLADFVFILIALWSLEFLAQSAMPLFVLVKMACGGFLIWLGLRTMRARPMQPGTLETAATSDGALSRLSSFTGGFLVTLGDPKAIAFYMGLFPAFVDTQEVSMLEIVLILLIATLVIAGVKLTYAALAERARRFFQRSRPQRILNACAGLILMIVGALVLLTTLKM